MSVRAGALARKGRLLFAGALSLCLHAAFFGLGLGLFHSPPGGGSGYVLMVDIAGGAQERADTAGSGAEAPAEPFIPPPPVPAVQIPDAAPSVGPRDQEVASLAPASMTAVAAKATASPDAGFAAPPSPVAAPTGEADASGNKSDALTGERGLGGQSAAGAAADGSDSGASGHEAGSGAAGGGPGGSGSGSSVGAGNADSAYFGQIMAEVERHKIYPEAARMRGTEGTVRIRLSISAEGRLVHAALSSSSGSSLLDRAALDLVASVFPMPNPTGRKLDAILGVNYSLTR